MVGSISLLLWKNFTISFKKTIFYQAEIIHIIEIVFSSRGLLLV